MQNLTDTMVNIIDKSLDTIEAVSENASMLYNKKILRRRKGNEHKMSDKEIATLRRIVEECAVWGCGEMRRFHEEVVDPEERIQSLTSTLSLFLDEPTTAWNIGKRIQSEFGEEVKDYQFPDHFFDRLRAGWHRVDSDTWKFVVEWEGSNEAGRVSRDFPTSQSWQVGHVNEVKVEGPWLVKGVLQKTASAQVEAGEPEVGYDSSIDPTVTSLISLDAEAETVLPDSILSDLQGLDLSGSGQVPGFPRRPTYCHKSLVWAEFPTSSRASVFNRPKNLYRQRILVHSTGNLMLLDLDHSRAAFPNEIRLTTFRA